MKKFLSFFFCLIILLSFAVSVSAVPIDNGTILISEETILEGGLTCVDEVILYPQQARASTRTAERRKSFYKDDTLIAIIAFTANYRFDGSSVSVLSKTVTQTDTYESWTYSQESFTSSGGTVTLAGKLKKWLIFTSSFTMSLTCDANGNISIS